MDRFWSKVRKTATCWEWTASTKNGYGQFGVENNPSYYAHRYSYELVHGPIPAGQYICHRCDNKKCVRPDHLFLGTQKDNMADALSKQKFPVGENNGLAKLTNAQVIEIRQLYANGVRQCRLAEQFNVSVQTMNGIVHRRHWKHINEG